MSRFPVAVRNGWLDGLAVSHISAFDGDPLAAGTEVSSARQPVVFGAAAAGARALGGTPIDIAIPAGEQVTHLAIHTALAAGSVEATHALPAAEVFGSAGTLRVNSWSLTVSDAP